MSLSETIHGENMISKEKHCHQNHHNMGQEILVMSMPTKGCLKASHLSKHKKSKVFIYLQNQFVNQLNLEQAQTIINSCATHNISDKYKHINMILQ
jgi:hypothetical protein